MRVVTRRTAGLSLIAVAIAGAGGCGVGDFFGHGSSAEPAVTYCDRDFDGMSAVKNNFDDCANTEDCPKGSYCDTRATKPFCDWECYSSSDCDSGAVCSCDGHCFADGESLPPGVDPTCQRDVGILSKAGDRRCAWDDDCPLGSHCSEATRVCRFECTKSEDCVAKNLGEVCSCLGTCVAAGSGPKPPTKLEPGAILPVVSVLATNIGVVQSLPPSESEDTEDPQVLPADWARRRVDIKVHREDSKQAWPTIHFRASRRCLDPAGGASFFADLPYSCGAIVEVCCGDASVCSGENPADGPMIWGPACGIPSERLKTLATLPDETELTDLELSIWVRPAKWSTSNDEWSMFVSAEGVASNAPVEVTFHPIDRKSTETASTPPVVPQDGVYEGKVTLTARVGTASGSTPSATSSGEPLAIPVKAIVRGDEIELFDGIGLLGANGKIRIRLDGGRVLTRMLMPSEETAGWVSGEVVATVTHKQNPVDTFGRRSGQLVYDLDPLEPMGRITFTWSYELDRTGSVESCADTDCVEAGFDRCDDSWSSCTWGEPWVSDVLECSGDGVCTAAGYARCDTEHVPPICTADAGTAFFSNDLAARWFERFSSHAQYELGMMPSDTLVFLSALARPETDFLNAWWPLYLEDNLYHASRGFAGIAKDSRPQVALIPPEIHADGYGLCLRDFRQYLSWIDNQKLNLKDVGVTLEAGNVAPKSVSPKLSDPQACDVLISVGKVTSSYFPPFPLLPGSGSFPPEKAWGIYSGRAPCVDASAPSAINKILAQSTTSAPLAATCQQVHANYQAATGYVGPYGTFVGGLCFKSAYQLKLSATISYSLKTDTHSIYLCPFREIMFGRADPITAVQRLMSYDPALESYPALSSSVLGKTVMPLSGDLATADDRAPRGVGVVTYEDSLELTGDAALTIGSGAMLAKCVEELTTEPPPPMPRITDTADGREYYEKLFGGTCFSPAIFYPALEILEQSIRSSRAVNPDVERSYLRLFQQWLALHAFMAREGLAVGRLAQALQSASAQNGPDSEVMVLEKALDQTPAMEDVLRAVEAGWSLLLEGAHGSVLLDRISWESLRLPDYRLAGSTGIHPDHEQGVGLSVGIVETASVHLALLEAYLLRTLRHAYVSCSAGIPHPERDRALAMLARTLRLTAATETIASEIYRKAATSGTVGWKERFEAARAEHSAQFAKAVAAGNMLERCINPLGISDDELPLFFGDPVGESGRFFASSDYLTTGWAVPTVEVARASLEAARRAWLEQRASRIQAQLSEQDADRRVEQLAAQYGNQLSAICGLTGVEYKDALGMFGDGPGELTADTCFLNMLDPTCREDAAPKTRLELDNNAKDAIVLQQCVIEKCGKRNALVAKYNDLASANLDGTDPEKLKRLYESAVATNDCAAERAACSEEKGLSAELLPEPEQIGLGNQMRADCYRGQLGEAFLAIMAAGQDVEIARASLANSEQLYQQQVTYCFNQASALEKLDDLRTVYDDDMREMVVERDQYAQIGSAFSTMASAASAAVTAGPGGALSAVVGGTFGMMAADVSSRMETRQARFEAETMAQRNLMESQACFHEANQLRVGTDTAVLRIYRALLDAEIAEIRFSNLRREVDQIVLEGNAVLEREEGRTVPSIAHHYWLDERLDRFTKDFDWAQRLTYLAMQSVEYEYQQSLPLRDVILGATHPDQLLDAVRAMQQEQLTRTINGRRPEEATVVLSLRDDILALQNQENVPVGERDWPPNVQFQNRLWRQQYQVFDNDDRYLGQGIPFTLTAIGPLAERCAERLWRVTATLQGDMLDVDAPTVSMFLMKRNSFQSQWCNGHGEEDTLQVGSVQPSSRLFDAGQRGGSRAVGITHVSAMLQPWLNVPKSEFYRDAYVEGASEELAGRGLYGDYVLVFPASGLLAEDFPLENVEDVLIRFDFLSVDDIQVNM
ncbi:MAG: dickkopf-related protein [Pseudomonadota bacterium]